MKKLTTIYITPDDIIELFKELFGILLWDQGAWRCPEGHIVIEWPDWTLHEEQNYMVVVTSPTDSFNEYDGNGGGYIISEQKALENIKTGSALDYDYAVSFLATYGHIDDADVYIVVSGICI